VCAGEKQCLPSGLAPPFPLSHLPVAITALNFQRSAEENRCLNCAARAF